MTIGLHGYPAITVMHEMFFIIRMVQVIVLIALMLLGDYSRCLTHYSVQNGDGIKKLNNLYQLLFAQSYVIAG